jgi:serine O-acetyltransferase
MDKIIYDDLYRYVGKRNFRILVRSGIFTSGFRYIFLFRKTQLASNKITNFFWKIALRQCMLRTGIKIPECTKVDKGFRIVHFGNIVINPEAVIGKNFNISHGVTIGSSQGRGAGVPTIGDNASIQTNAVVIGGIKVVNDVLIAPNAFVNFDVPDGSIVIGNPGQIINQSKASAKYIVYSLD